MRGVCGRGSHDGRCWAKPAGRAAAQGGGSLRGSGWAGRSAVPGNGSSEARAVLALGLGLVWGGSSAAGPLLRVVGVPGRGGPPSAAACRRACSPHLSPLRGSFLPLLAAVGPRWPGKCLSQPSMLLTPTAGVGGDCELCVFADS